MTVAFGSPVTATVPVSVSVGSSLGFSGAVVIDPRKCTGSPVPTAVPASTREISRSPVTVAAPASASVGSFLGFSGAVVINQRMGDITQTPIAGYSNVVATHNTFSPLSGLGCGEDLCFGEKDDLMVVPGAKGGDYSNLDVEPVLPSQVGGFELLQDGLEHLRVSQSIGWLILVVSFMVRRRMVFWNAHLFPNGIPMVRRSWR